MPNNRPRAGHPQRRPRNTRPGRKPILLRIAVGSLIVMTLPIVLILLLRWIPAPTSAFMIAQRLGGNKPAYEWVAWSDISPEAAIAVVAAEDQNFPTHWGFDFKAISQAFEERNTTGRIRGASTISQQTAKNLFLWQGKSWLRKGLEAGLTVVIEWCWPKQRILEVYLNIAQFGPDTFGIAAASRTYFNTAPSRLTAEQAALLAAALPSPSRSRLSAPSPYLLQRAAHIQRQVRQLGGPGYLAPLTSL